MKNRKLIFAVIALLLAAALLLGTSACDRIVGPRGNNNANANKNSGSESTDDPRYVKQAGQGMSEYDIDNRFETYCTPMCFAIEYYGGKGLDYVAGQEIELDGHTWAPSALAMFDTLESIESYVDMFFTGGFLKDLRTTAGMEGDEYAPRYRDVDGKLYVRTDEPNESLMFSIDLDTFTIVSNTEEEIKFTVDATLNGGLYELRIIMSPVGESGWKISYWYPEPKDSSSESSN